jgi:hypothetical protein
MWQEARFSNVAVLSLALITISVIVVTLVRHGSGGNYLTSAK